MHGVRLVAAPTLTELHVDLCDMLAQAFRIELDLVTSVDVHVHDVVATTPSMAWSFDLKDLWLTRSRWTTMVRQYVDPAKLDQWLEQVERVHSLGRGVCMMRARDVVPRSAQTKPSRVYGGCMTAWTFRVTPQPHLTMFSRTSYLGYIGALDLTVAHHLAREAGARVGLEPEQIALTWHLDAAQFHGFKSVAWMLNHPEPRRRKWLRHKLLTRRRPESAEWWEARPALKITRRWLDQVHKEDAAGKLYADEKYGAYKRIRRRFHSEIVGLEHARKYEGRGVKAYPVLPSVEASSLFLRELLGE